MRDSTIRDDVRKNAAAPERLTPKASPVFMATLLCFAAFVNQSLGDRFVVAWWIG